MKRCSSMSKPLPKRRKLEQLCLDVGQKKFGEIECMKCGMVYNHNHAKDRKQHEKFHSGAIVFRGWKSETVVAMFDGPQPLTGQRQPSTSSSERIISVDSGSKIKSHLKRVAQIAGSDKTWSKAYLYVAAHEVVGYALTKACSSSEGVKEPDGPMVAVSTIWQRREEVKTRLLDAVRSTFLPGKIIPKEKMVFLDDESESST